jgi:uncharacterized protein
MHYRLEPKQHRFRYKVFLFYLDLDEIDELSRKMRWMSRNRFNLFNFRDRDHLRLPADHPDTSKNVREHLVDYLRAHQIEIGNGRIHVLTNLCTLGYQFNPVSFYYCYDEQGRPLCSVVEVGNTFGELKPYFLGPDSQSRNEFRRRMPKYFYVSPFSDMDTYFDFELGIPDRKLRVKIDDYDREGRRFFISTLSGRRKELTDANLLLYFFSIPLITLKVIGLIHWEAFRLWTKKLPFHKKEDNKDLQKEVFRAYKQ